MLSYVWALEGWSPELVLRVVKDFVCGKVKRSPSQRSKVPTAEELAAQLRLRADEMGGGEATDRGEYAPPFGPLWGVQLYALLAQGPDERMPPPTRFFARMIAKGGETGAHYRLEHQAHNGFKQVAAMMQAAEQARGCRADKALAKFVDRMEPVPTEGETFEQWFAEHRRRGWPWLPRTGRQRVVYFPKGGPIALEAMLNELRNGDVDA
jgi:hypothetical protein